MPHSKQSIANRVADAASVYHQQRTGHAPLSVTVVLSDCTVVVTLHHALAPSEMALANNPQGSVKVQDFHRKLFANDAKSLCEEIQRITGIAVREAVVEVEPDTGNVVHAFSTGNAVEIFQMKNSVPLSTWRLALAGNS